MPINSLKTILLNLLAVGAISVSGAALAAGGATGDAGDQKYLEELAYQTSLGNILVPPTPISPISANPMDTDSPVFNFHTPSKTRMTSTRPLNELEKKGNRKLADKFYELVLRNDVPPQYREGHLGGINLDYPVALEMTTDKTNPYHAFYNRYTGTQKDEEGAPGIGNYVTPPTTDNQNMLGIEPKPRPLYRTYFKPGALTLTSIARDIDGWEPPYIGKKFSGGKQQIAVPKNAIRLVRPVRVTTASQTLTSKRRAAQQATNRRNYNINRVFNKKPLKK